VTYPEAEAALLALPRFAEQGAAAMKPGLERMEALLAAMGRPHEGYPSVHVAGTNGKGSTASMIAAIASASGLRVGLHTSPHLHALGERMRLDGVPAPEAWLAEAVARHRALFERVEPSFFEATVALSLLYFGEMRVDLAVVEVGLGGRLDATNVLRPRLSVVTHVGRDHADLLGDTLEAIAREKAGIAKPGVPLLSAAEGSSVRAALRAEAEARGAPFLDLDDEARFSLRPPPWREPSASGLVLDLETSLRAYPALRVPLAGGHQARNAALAVRAAELALPGVGEGAVRDGLARVAALSGLAGRMEVLHRDPLLLADVAHNADGLRAALRTFEALAPGGRRAVAFGVMRDKEPEALAALLAEAGVQVYPVPLATPRAVPPEDLLQMLQAEGANVLPPTRVDTVVRAFLRGEIPADALLVTGSHLAAAEAHGALSTPLPLPDTT
jgi:dihydrofolate synthase / folylpolyglutamate synthase